MRIPLAPVSKPSKSTGLIPIFHPKTSIRRIALLLLLPLGANLFLQRWKLSVPTKLLTHSQWRCQFSRPRHCGLDNLIGEARRCVPGRGIQMLYHRLSQCWLLSWWGDSRFDPPPLLLLLQIPPSLLRAGGGSVMQAQAPERILCLGGNTALWPQSLRATDVERCRGGGWTCTAITWESFWGRHKISQQIMKLSLIARESEGWRGLSVGSPVQEASTGHEKHVFGGTPAVNECSVSLRSWHSLGLKDAQRLERSTCKHIPLYFGSRWMRLRDKCVFSQICLCNQSPTSIHTFAFTFLCLANRHFW